MPVTIMAGYALGSLLCILIGEIFYGNPDLLLNSREEGGIIGKIGIAIAYFGALIGAAMPWVILFVINPESKRFRSSKNENPPIIKI